MSDPAPTTEPRKRKKFRSPSYPGVALDKALGYAREFWRHENRHAAPVAVAASHWGFGPKSSGGLVAIAALKQFGLFEDSGSGDERKVKLTDTAQRIILDERPESEERANLLKRVALRPKIHSELWEKWGTSLPSDQTISTFLVLERRYSKEAANQLSKEYQETVTFARLSESDIVSAIEEEHGKDAEPEGSSDMRGTVAQANPAPSSPNPEKPIPVGAGERQLAQFPLPGGRSVRLLFGGPLPTQREIEKLIALLELTKDTFPSEE